MELSQQLHALVAEIDGVTAVYPPRSLLARAHGSAAAVARRAESSPVLVKAAGDSLTVTVRIGVSASRQAPAVAEAVAVAVDTHVRQTRPDVSSVDVDVQICSVTP